MARKTRNRGAGTASDQSRSIYDAATAEMQVCSFEQLEARLLLDATPIGPQFFVDDEGAVGYWSQENTQAAAMDADGDFLIVWTAGYGSGLFGRFFSSAGQPVGDIVDLVDPGQHEQLRDPSVAMDADGDFVLAWRSIDYYLGEESIYARRFDADGLPEGDANIDAATGYVREPAVASDSDGNFLVVWQEEYGSTGLMARQFTSNGVGGPVLHLVTPPEGWETRDAAVAMDDGGDFVVTWSRYESGQGYSSIIAQHFLEGGMADGPSIVVSPHTEENGPIASSVGMDANGDFAVAWSACDFSDNWQVDVRFQRYDSSMTPLADAVTVVAVPGYRTHPSLAMDDAGDFVVAWNEYDGWDMSTSVLAQRYSADGSPQLSAFLVTPEPHVGWVTGGVHQDVAADADGDFVVVWQTGNYGYGGIAAQFGNSDGSPRGPVYRLVAPGSEATISDPAVDMDDAGNLVLVWDQYDWMANERIVYAQRFSPDSTPLGQPFEVAAGMGVVDDADVAVDADGDFIVVWQLGYYGEGGVWGQRFDAEGVPTGTAVRFVGPQPSGWGDQTSPRPRVAMDADGDFALTYRLSQAYGGSYSAMVVIQRFTAAGMPAGLPIPSAMIGSSVYDIAMDADGDLLALWGIGLHDGGYGVLGVVGQRLDRYDQPLGPARLYVPAPTGGGVLSSAVAMDADGDATVLWSEHGPYGYMYHQSLVQKFHGASGIPAGAAAFVSRTDSMGSYYDPSSSKTSVAANAEGSSLVVWVDGRAGTNGIVGRFYGPDGQSDGGVYRLVAPRQAGIYEASVAMDDEGDFVVVWREEDIYNNSQMVFAQTFGAGAVPTSGQMLVAFATDGSSLPRDPSVAMDAQGDFLVVWQLGYADEGEIWGRSFDADGTPAGSAALLVASEPGLTTVSDPDVAMDADGDFAVAWISYATYGEMWSVEAQRFGSSGLPDGQQMTIDSAPSFYPLSDPSVAMDSDGEMLVSWMFHGYYGVRDTTLYVRFAPAGEGPGSYTALVPERYGYEILSPDVAMDDSGNAIAVWELYEWAHTQRSSLRAVRFTNSPDPQVAGDANDDGFVGQADLDIILGQWGQGDPIPDPRADLSGDDFVGQADLDIVLGNWGGGTIATEQQIARDDGLVTTTGSHDFVIVAMREDDPAESDGGQAELAAAACRAERAEWVALSALKAPLDAYSVGLSGYSRRPAKVAAGTRVAAPAESLADDPLAVSLDAVN